MSTIQCTVYTSLYHPCLEFYIFDVPTFAHVVYIFHEYQGCQAKHYKKLHPLEKNGSAAPTAEQCCSLC